MVAILQVPNLVKSDLVFNERLTEFSVDICRSSYYYQENVIHAADKYAEIRNLIVKLFHDNRDVFGYRKIHMLLKNQGITLSEKVIRRIMKDENLIIKKRRRRKYNSYKGEITPPVENIVNRDFHADKPNQKWLTDITEFSIKAGKVYLSPMIDCLDGMPLTWTIGIYPNADLTNTMLRKAISTLKPGEKPISILLNVFPGCSRLFFCKCLRTFRRCKGSKGHTCYCRFVSSSLRCHFGDWLV